MFTEQPNYSDVTDKPFLAVYYNLARHNVYLTLSHIYGRFGISENTSEDDPAKWLKNNFPTHKWNAIERSRFLDMIHDHFPFLEIINLDNQSHNKNEKPVYDKERNIQILIDLIDHLTQFRNFYSHAIHPDLVPINKQFYYSLNAILDANVHKVKRDFFGINANDFKQIDPFEEKIKHLRRYTKNYDKSLVDEKGKTMKSVKNPEFKLHFYDQETNGLTVIGHTFFASLFLEKKHSMLMQKRVRGLKNATETKFRMTNEVMCRTHIHLPNVKLRSDVTQDSLTLDMVTELSKAPTEFYLQLPDTEKQKFKTIEIDDDSDEWIVASGERKENRFTYFALRYFDEASIFKHLRFHVDLGHYHYHLYESIINGVSEKRKLTKHLFGFGRIQEFAHENAPKEWKDKRKELEYYEAETDPFITATYPHYHIEQHKIGIRFLFNDQSSIWPSIEVVEKSEISNYPKISRLPNEGEIAQAFLSEKDVPAMLFCHLLYGEITTPNRVEEIIKSKWSNLTRLLKDVRNQSIDLPLDQRELWDIYHLKPTEIPQRLFQYLSNTEVVSTTNATNAVKRFHELIENTNNLIERFKVATSSEIKIGKKQYRRLESGKYADWLAEDLMRFQPIAKDKNGEPILRSKANPKKYQLIQKSLALYSLEKDRLQGLFRDCNLIDSDNPHPFLARVVAKNHTSWQEFYKHYLALRLSYIKECLQKGQQNNNFDDYQSFLKIKAQNIPITEIDGWSRQLFLPSGLFDEAILEWFQQNMNEVYNELIPRTEKTPQLFSLVEKYLEVAYNDSFQSFYAELPLVYNRYAKSIPNGLKLNERQQQAKQWFDDLKAAKTYLEEQRDFSEKVKNKGKEILKKGLTSHFAIKKQFEEELGHGLFSDDFNKQFYKLKNKRNKKIVEDCEKDLLKKLREKETFIAQSRALLNNEKVIRDHKMTDGILSCLIRKLLQEQLQISHSEVFELKSVEPIGAKGDKGYLNQLQELNQELKFYQTSDTGSFMKQNGQKIELGSWMIYSTDIKRKNKGAFHSLLKDRRLNNLAMYLKVPENGAIPKIAFSRLKHELDLYERKRLSLVRYFYLIELEILKSMPELKGDVGFENFRLLMDRFLENKPIITSEAAQKIVYLRNALLHNQYPLPKFFTEVIPYSETLNMPENNGLGIMLQLEEIVIKASELFIEKLQAK